MLKARWMQGALLALLAAGCGPPRVGYFRDDRAGGAGGNASLECDGTCASLPAAGWTRDHVLLWTGAQAEAPPCPANAATPYRTGYADLIAPGVCDACTCNAPACVLPGGVTASSSSCPGSAPGSVYTDVDAPPAWDGACTSTGNVPFSDAVSMEITAPTVTACAPVTTAVAAKFAPPSWGKYVLTCQGTAYGRCDDSGSSCVPAPDPRFRLCLERSDMYAQPETDACPDDYPERHLVFQEFDDLRSCTPCACDAPIGSDCSALLSTYGNAGCTDIIGSNALSIADPVCMNNATSTGLASIAATWLTNAPGKCKPTGGDLVGNVVARQASLFCCQPVP